MNNSMELVRKIQDDLYASLKDVDGVNGIGITPDTGAGLGIKVNVIDQATADKIALPTSVDDVPVLVEIVGTARAL
jgi:hypothetical protein